MTDDQLIEQVDQELRRYAEECRKSEIKKQAPDPLGFVGETEAAVRKMADSLGFSFTRQRVELAARSDPRWDSIKGFHESRKGRKVPLLRAEEYFQQASQYQEHEAQADPGRESMRKRFTDILNRDGCQGIFQAFEKAGRNCAKGEKPTAKAVAFELDEDLNFRSGQTFRDWQEEFPKITKPSDLATMKGNNPAETQAMRKKLTNFVHYCRKKMVKADVLEQSRKLS
ncbi:MAG: hypothetical protein ACE15E_00525 [Acidobacteriota bacterium]